MPRGKFFQVSYGIILILLIIYLGSLVDFIFQPVVVLVSTLFAPIVIAGVLYYLFRPVVNVLSEYLRMPRGVAILMLYLATAGVLTLLVLIVGPALQNQFLSLVDNVPSLINEAQRMIVQLQNQEWFNRFIDELEGFSWSEVTARAADYVNEALSNLGSNIASVVGAITSVLMVLIILPFILFYMLKEGEKAPEFILRLLPAKQEEESRRILKDMDTALSSYIQGQIIVSFFVGICVYIGYVIIGLDYPLVLAAVAMFTNVIPFIGPWIGTFPGVIVGLLDSPFMALLVVIVVVIVQQIESNFISPQVMGRKLHIHPLTIILLLLVAGRFAGLVGLLLAVPTYAVLKVFVSHTYRLLKLRNNPPKDDGV
ncbi:Predicted PurR-regulated permease PerM [Alteribacillus persepolensis]|uniref:Predicted PurR-regulated permease PerM n=1 Tax=Alteribacillus persepolensis TaxID=568899 RepID=A0A1G8H4W8_9BACI|nr:AI-2E family transporter [Alteribacillus persepolensis]SDI01560.1 Predicted PurR-regulated permease PerM [Alteribacillus persepolensis]